MFGKLIRFALVISFIFGVRITLKRKDVVGKVYFIEETEGEIRGDVIAKAGNAILEENIPLMKFEDAIKKPGAYICLVKKEDGKKVLFNKI